MNTKLPLILQVFRGNWWLMSLYIISSSILMFPLVSISLLLNADLGCTPAEMSFYYATTFIPWNFRSLYGLISDTVPIFNCRRKSYLVLCYSALCVCMASFGQYVENFEQAVMVGVVSSIFMSFSESVVDAIAVDRVVNSLSDLSSSGDRHSTSVDIQSCAMASRTVGSIVAVSLAGSIARVCDSRTIISLGAIVPGVGLIISLCVRMESSGSSTIVHQKTKLLWDYLKTCIRERKRPTNFTSTTCTVVGPCLFILLYASCPSSNVIYNSFLVNELKFSNAEYHAISLTGAIGGLLGTFIYWMTFRERTNIRQSFVVAVLLSSLAILSRLLVVHVCRDIYFVCADEALLSVTQRLALMPIQVYAAMAASAPEHLMFEGFVFGLFASVENWGGTLSGFVSGMLIGHMSLSEFIILCSSLSIIPVLALGCLRVIPNHQDVNKCDASNDTCTDAATDVNKE